MHSQILKARSSAGALQAQQTPVPLAPSALTIISQLLALERPAHSEAEGPLGSNNPSLSSSSLQRLVRLVLLNSSLNSSSSRPQAHLVEVLVRLVPNRLSQPSAEVRSFALETYMCVD